MHWRYVFVINFSAKRPIFELNSCWSFILTRIRAGVLFWPGLELVLGIMEMKYNYKNVQAADPVLQRGDQHALLQPREPEHGRGPGDGRGGGGDGRPPGVPRQARPGVPRPQSQCRGARTVRGIHRRGGRGIQYSFFSSLLLWVLLFYIYNALSIFYSPCGQRAGLKPFYSIVAYEWMVSKRKGVFLE